MKPNRGCCEEPGFPRPCDQWRFEQSTTALVTPHTTGSIHLVRSHEAGLTGVVTNTQRLRSLPRIEFFISGTCVVCVSLLTVVRGLHRELLVCPESESGNSPKRSLPRAHLRHRFLSTCPFAVIDGVGGNAKETRGAGEAVRVKHTAVAQLGARFNIIACPIACVFWPLTVVFPPSFSTTCPLMLQPPTRHPQLRSAHMWWRGRLASFLAVHGNSQTTFSSPECV
ncbi:hypothetical protein BaRGS_00004600 [Batillaria attramentaria]|uniref:Uncharacterized protein n=1 Tax=Batillaria attramentaria TaxID=370345 RepID=A0ABD0LXV5_9CAEN